LVIAAMIYNYDPISYIVPVQLPPSNVWHQGTCYLYCVRTNKPNAYLNILECACDEDAPIY